MHTKTRMTFEQKEDLQTRLILDLWFTPKTIGSICDSVGVEIKLVDSQLKQLEKETIVYKKKWN